VDTRDEARDGHLRSPDFFDAEAYPVITYRSTTVTPAGKGRWVVEGELTVRDTTQVVPLEVTFEGGARDPWGGARIGFTAHTELDREAFGLTWNQALETGGVLVGKQVRIDIEAEAIQQ
jgi:polyisoprenoid-binding protein YceI